MREGEEIAWTRAITGNDLELARALTAMRASSRNVGVHALMHAIKQKHAREVDAQVLDLVLKAGANPNAKELNNYYDTLLHRAVVQGRTDKVQVLLDNGADPNALDGNKYTPLGAALVGFGESPAPFERRQSLVSILLAAGADPRRRGRVGGRDSMLSMVPLGNLDLGLATIKVLIEHGADPADAGVLGSPDSELQVENEAALLFRAVEIPNVELLDRFLGFMEEYGQGPSTRGAKGQTLIHDLIQAWHPLPGRDGGDTAFFYGQALELLEKRGYDLAARDNDGNTIWHAWAKGASPFAWTGHALLDYPATRDIVREVDNSGRSPLDILLNKPAWIASGKAVQHVVSKMKEIQMQSQLPQAPSPSAQAPSLPRRSRF